MERQGENKSQEGAACSPYGSRVAGGERYHYTVNGVLVDRKHSLRVDAPGVVSAVASVGKTVMLGSLIPTDSN